MLEFCPARVVARLIQLQRSGTIRTIARWSYRSRFQRPWRGSLQQRHRRPVQRIIGTPAAASKAPHRGAFFYSDRASLRGGGFAPAEMAQAAVDPQLGQFLLRAILRQPPAQGRKIDPVEILVL